MSTSQHPDLVLRETDPINGGPPPDRLTANVVTPNDLFFIRNHAPVPEVDPGLYRLSVRGLVERSLVLPLDDLARMPRTEIGVTLQCAGNRRRELMAHRAIPNELEWDHEAISHAVWSGVALRDLLERSGVRAGASHVELMGSDAGASPDGTPFGSSIPLAKAMGDEVLIADTMNGQPLAPIHGFPLRAVVPGYIAARSVKWLHAVNVLDGPSGNYFQAGSYRLFPTEMKEPPPDPALGEAIGECPITSAITEPARNANLAPGTLRVRGYAYSGGDRQVARVEVSPDGGGSWTDVALSPTARWSWRLWEHTITIESGEHELIVRAWDSAGNAQPETIAQVWNCKGYLNNAWHRVPVRVRD